MGGIILPIFIFISIWCTSSAFTCDSNATCECEQFGSQYELRCTKFSVSYWPDQGVQFNCNSDGSADFSDLYDSDFGDSPTVTFSNCDIPDIPFSQIFNSSGITNVKGLTFQSLKKLHNSLKANHFDGLTDLTLLNLENNFFTSFPFNIFHDMIHLTRLSLRNNALRLDADLFLSTRALEFLELGSNNLSTLPSGIFQNLENLTLLNLEQNQFQTVVSDWFEGLKNLETLDLHNNNIDILPENSFQYIPKMKKIVLSMNHLTSLPYGLFSNNTNLEEVILVGNRNNLGNLGNGTFTNLTKLSKLVLNESKIASLSADFLNGAIGLKSLFLKGNNLRNLPEQLFSSTTELQFLDLSNNQIESLPQNIFASLKKLQNLSLGFNNIKYISENVLTNLPALVSLNFKGNGMTNIAKLSLQGTPNLKFVDASDNYLNFSRIDNDKSIFSPCDKMEILQLQNNSIETIYSDFQFMSHLTLLNLQYNKISSLGFSTFSFTGSQTYVDLQYNNITTITVWPIYLYHEVQVNFLITFNLQHNPLNCDCWNYYFYKLVQGGQEEQNFLKNFKFETNDLRCATPTALVNQTIKNINPKDLVCQLPECPSKCTCWRRDFDKTTVINCSYGNYSEIPHYLPMYTTSGSIALNMSHNNFVDVSSNKSGNFSSVNTLDLSYNYIHTIYPQDFPQNLTSLYLNNNNITAISQNTLNYFHGMKNKLLALYNNPFHCNCDAVEFLKFIRKNLASLILSNNITCYDMNLQIQNLSVDDLCKTYTTVIIAVSLTLTFLGVGAAVVAALYYRNQHTIKVWMYSHKLCMWFVTESELDKDKLFDAFISYSHKDEDFVTSELVNELEGGEPKYKLCLHYRDWIAGEWIPNQVVRSVDDSRRTIVVLSKNFLESVWGRLEFKAAHLQALQDKTRRVIIIVYGEVPDTKDLDEELRAYISMNTYLKWDDPWFWQKLRYAMPHKCQMIKKSRANVDRLELIRTEILSNQSPLHSPT